MRKILLFLLLSVFTFSLGAAIIQDSGHDTVVTTPIQKEKEKLTILTNPVKDGYLKLTFSSSTSNDLNLTIINSLGKQVYNAKRSINSDEQTFDVSKLSTGMYFLRVSTTSSNFVKKLIIR
ncbi:hypothetical protein CW736_08645 [Nonlabens sp. MB-3u-79]|jgi:hypothetical protein|uniref:T9SS type A sorting domain-containing protein n=1 Tax=Nonlabens sp. MB-3u-79 TaxID=2058134 RepID=UPI000C30F759|nr:T9SS type A sorting domain-containing protein [Nonlabens sp. MB-3u-79]AUC79436.1 hypothetical protein CW736_08645 [Nonlabens sp. MB-3u-79]|tara:strand:+ start:236 stop:598 length:363 start_codon:yes stop_codon:yes gene_type:complete